MTTLLVTQSSIDALVLGNPSLRVTQAAIDVLVTVADIIPLNYPDSPTVGQIFQRDNRKWEYTGVYWKTLGSNDPLVYSGSTPIDFPSSPTINQVYTVNGLKWKWDGVSRMSNN